MRSGKKGTISSHRAVNYQIITKIVIKVSMEKRNEISALVNYSLAIANT